MKHIASVSFGKDSLAMLLALIKNGDPLDEAVFYDTGMEFNAIYDIRDKIKPLLAAKGITYTELKPSYTFEYKMFNKLVHERSGGTHYGYSWCGGRCRWGTTDKLQALDKYAKKQSAVIYVGIAADEHKRIIKERKSYKQLPLVSWGMTEKECLQLCYENGYFWNESSVRLYDILKRVSCWCCGNKNLAELRNIYEYLPDYWERLKALQSRTSRPMKGEGKSVFDLEKRFVTEKMKHERTARENAVQMQITY